MGKPPRIILGLGNPGARYTETRHNVGFRVVEKLADQRRIRLDRDECNALVGWDEELALAAPQTFMNRSGFSARCFMERWGLEPESFLVVYDEVHLPLGSLRLRPKGSPAGHRGMESVLENLGSDRVARLRLGVGGPDAPAPGEALVDFVLEPFAANEVEAVEEMIGRAAEACELWAREGAGAAMQKFNRRVETTRSETMRSETTRSEEQAGDPS